MSLSNEPSQHAPAGVERLSVEPVPSRPRRPLHAVESQPEPSQTLETPQPPPGFAAAVAAAKQQGALASQGAAQQASLNAQVQAVFAAISRVLAVKAQLLLTLIGAFVLAIMAMREQSSMGLYLLVAWCCLAVLPMVWLDFAGRQRRP